MLVFLILWVPPVIALLMGVSGKFFRNWLQMWSVVFAVYLSLWSLGLLSGLARFCPAEGQPYARAITLLLSAGAVWYALNFLQQQFLPLSSNEYETPPIIERSGAAACRFLTGLVMTDFVLILLFLTPLKGVLPEENQQELCEKTVERCLAVTAIVNDLSLQPGQTAQCRKSLETLLNIAPKEQNEPEEHL